MLYSICSPGWIAPSGALCSTMATPAVGVGVAVGVWVAVLVGVGVAVGG